MANPLRAYREKHGLSQAELASMLKVSRQMVGLLEKGERNYTAEMALTIERRLGIDRVLTRPDLFRRKAA
jgi:transcriptional regulator with XRE-family HTH domain